MEPNPSGASVFADVSRIEIQARLHRRRPQTSEAQIKAELRHEQKKKHRGNPPQETTETLITDEVLSGSLLFLLLRQSEHLH